MDVEKTDNQSNSLLEAKTDVRSGTPAFKRVPAIVYAQTISTL